MSNGAQPAKKLAIIACMDARLDPLGVLGLEVGDAHVIRNAGGVITDDEIRSLAISQNLLGTRDIAVIHHTDCGMLKFTDEEFKRRLEEDFGHRPEWEPGAFENLDRNLRDTIERIKESPFLPSKESIRGYIYEVETGILREIS